jgi:Ion transport protein
VDDVNDPTECASLSSSNVWQTAVNNCGSVGAPLYFILFQILGVFVLLNLMVAVITETFSLSKNAGTEVGLVTNTVLARAIPCKLA